MLFREYQKGRCFVGRFGDGTLLLEALTDFVTAHKIALGEVSVIGAVHNAVFGFYDLRTKQYQVAVIDEPMEITACTGNISQKGGAPWLHLHITLAREDGRAIGGHLMEETRVLSAEFVIEEFVGEPLERHQDEATGLSLWA